MDGKIYDSMWNSYNFQPPPLDLQSYIPTSREPFQTEQTKTPFTAAPSSMFFSYPNLCTSHNYQHSPADCTWQGPTLSEPNTKAPGFYPGQNIKERDTSFKYAHSLVTEGIPDNPAGLSIPEPVSSNDRADIMPTCNVTSSIKNLCNQHASPNAEKGGELPHVEEKTKIKNSGFSKKREKSLETLTLKKRGRDEESWARNVRKKARSKGESYISVQGKVVPARSVKPVDCSKCKFNCPSRITEENRQNLFSKYWALETLKEKVDYISSCVHEFTPLRPVSGRRAFSRRYTLKIDGREERVCKEFFMATFDICESTIVTYMDKKRKGAEAIADLRGKQTPSNKTPDLTVKCIREHILSQIGLHGWLTKSPRDDVQNVKKLYHHYQSECEADKMKPASISVYRKVYAEIHKALVELPPKDTFRAQLKPNCKAALKSLNGNTGLCSVGKDCITAVPTLDDITSVSKVDTASHQLGDNRCSAPTIVSLGNKSHSDLMSHFYQSSQQNFPAPLGIVDVSTSLNVSNPYHQPQGQQTHNYHSDHQHQHDDLINNHNNAKLLQSVALQNNFLLPSERSGPFESECTSAWEPKRNDSSGAALNYCSSLTASLPSHIPQSISLSSSSVFNCKINAVPNLAAVADNKTVNTLPESPSIEAKKNHKRTSSSNKVAREVKGQMGPKKTRCRNEDSWGRNVRKRLRFKGEAYTSVRGKLVEAKRVKKVDCSKCKFKCTNRITEEQREKLNLEYWNLDTYQKKIEHLTKFVETYVPKRKMTGRRAYSRKYTFELQGREERVCKDFFKSTLHISESTIATALEKSRKGPEAIVDMRGKHRPVNKTTEETLQSIRELIIYMTGLRPYRTNSSPSFECKDVHRLYQVYKYDCERKSKKVASLGIFRNIFMKEFEVKTFKSKKGKRSDKSSLETCFSANYVIPGRQSNPTGSIPK